MKITNFRLIKKTGTGPLTWKFKAIVTVETGFFLKKKKDREIYRIFGEQWCFCDTGEFTPGCAVENLERAFTAKRMQHIEDCEI